MILLAFGLSKGASQSSKTQTTKVVPEVINMMALDKDFVCCIQYSSQRCAQVCLTNEAVVPPMFVDVLGAPATSSAAYASTLTDDDRDQLLYCQSQDKGYHPGDYGWSPRNDDDNLLYIQPCKTVMMLPCLQL